MPKGMKPIFRLSGHRCLHCNVFVPLGEAHPERGVEFRNGYPAPCRMNGRDVIGYLMPWDTEVHWMAVTEQVER